MYVYIYIYMHICTHYDTISCFLRALPRLNLQDEIWEEVPPMVTGRDELAVVASGGCIYAMGGSHLVWPVP